MYDDLDRLRDQETIRACEERWLDPDYNYCDDDVDDADYPYDTTEEAYD
ncbi:hypothetical protein [Huintestinicola sp.]